jgi:hypothetical protein
MQTDSHTEENATLNIAYPFLELSAYVKVRLPSVLSRVGGEPWTPARNQKHLSFMNRHVRLRPLGAHCLE